MVVMTNDIHSEESFLNPISRSRSAVAASMVSMVVLAACSGTGSGTASATSQGSTGFVSIHGSSTVEPITSAVAEKYADANADFDYEVGDEGTGDGFASFFCTGDSDISDASRQIKDEEAAQCSDAGVEYTELQIGYDGLSVVTSADDTSIECLSFLDVYALLGPESEGFTKWSDANDLAAELADQFGNQFGESHAPYPDAGLTVSGPGEESGTFDSFNELVILPVAEARGKSEDESVVRPDYTSSSNDNDIVTAIGGSPSSLGWVGLHFAEENADTIKAIPVDGGDGCVAPTSDTVSDKSYPISRPLFFYVNNAKVDENPALGAFVDFYLSDEGIASVTEEGYVALPDDQLQATRDAWASH
jgi:phosphate transport system substrate-binding protein